MSDRFVLGAYWGVRRESAEQCADRLRVFFTGLADGSDLFKQWYSKASSPKKSLEQPVKRDNHQQLVELLLRGQNRENVRNEISEDLGFQVGFWNGRKGDTQSSFSLRCGLYWTSSNPNVSVSNCVVLDLPKELGILAEANQMVQLLIATVQAWSPDWAGVMLESSMLSRSFDWEAPFVDWMVYVPRRIKTTLDVASIREVADGSIIVVQSFPPSVDDPSPPPVIARVESALK